MTSQDNDDGAYREFKRPAQTACEFCEMLKRRLQAVPGAVSSQQNITRLEVRSQRSLSRDEEHLNCTFSVCTDTRKLYESELNFAIWADKGIQCFCYHPKLQLTGQSETPACERLVTRLPMLRPQMKDVYNLANNWLSECMSFHEACGSTQSGILPTRVLQISGNLGNPAVRLLETESMGGANYCALSHCWGPANKQPLRTTRENYQCHLGGISHELLPKSFREAIMLTQALNIEYLWIDSLCIVQDDEHDWRSEAGKMAGVFQNAALIIAAADAKDSSEGLFITERKRKIIMTVPYIVESMIQGSFNIAQLPRYKLGPARSHLNTRAWAFQERLLARRIMFFTRRGISWKCKEIETWERGSHKYLGFYEYLSWLTLLGTYSGKRLTNAGDRLHALMGVVEAMKKTREDNFNPFYGIWEIGLDKQLLWRQDEPIEEAETLNLPTWTWAATGGAKIWCMASEEDGTAHTMPPVLDLNSSGALTSSGHISRQSLVLRSLASSQKVFELPRDGIYGRFHEKFILPGCWTHRDFPSYVVTDASDTSGILGMATFDRAPSTTARCFFVVRHERRGTPDSDESSSASGSDMQQDEVNSPECVQEGKKHHTEPPSSNDQLNSRCTNEAQSSFDEVTESHRTFDPAPKGEDSSQLANDVSDVQVTDESDSDSDDVDSDYSDDSETDSEMTDPESVAMVSIRLGRISTV
jgi:hypothetical protein